MSITRGILSVSRHYTETLEEVLGLRLSTDDVKRKEIKQSLSEAAQVVRVLSEGLTADRDTFLSGSYLSKAATRKAYQLYYTTTNLAKVIPPLRELAFSKLFTMQSLRVLDLGTGAGAAVWGLMQFLEEEVASPPLIEITVADKVKDNLLLVDKFYSTFSKKMTSVRSSLDTMFLDIEKLDIHHLTERRFDLILVMNTLNELSESGESKLLRAFDEMLADGGSVILIEPAAKEQSRRALAFRDKAVQGGFTVYAPCTRQADCPALISDNDWCHSEYKWTRPEFIRVIDDEAGTLRLSLKCSYFILNKSGARLTESFLFEKNPFRVVSERFDEKGRIRAVCCGEAGRKEYVLNKRSKSDTNKDFASIERYDLVNISGVIEREHDNMISEASKITVMLHNSGAR